MRSLKDIFRNTSQQTAEGILACEGVAQRTAEGMLTREDIFDINDDSYVMNRKIEELFRKFSVEAEIDKDVLTVVSGNMDFEEDTWKMFISELTGAGIKTVKNIKPSNIKPWVVRINKGIDFQGLTFDLKAPIHFVSKRDLKPISNLTLSAISGYSQYAVVFLRSPLLINCDIRAASGGVIFDETAFLSPCQGSKIHSSTVVLDVRNKNNAWLKSVNMPDSILDWRHVSLDFLKGCNWDERAYDIGNYGALVVDFIYKNGNRAAQVILNYGGYGRLDISGKVGVDKLRRDKSSEQRVKGYYYK